MYVYPFFVFLSSTHEPNVFWRVYEYIYPNIYLPNHESICTHPPPHLFASSKESTYFPPPSPPPYCGGCGGDGEGGGGAPLGVLNRFALLALEIASGCIRGAAPPPPLQSGWRGRGTFRRKKNLSKGLLQSAEHVLCRIGWTLLLFHASLLCPFLSIFPRCSLF
jgi:hypothetical protein